MADIGGRALAGADGWAAGMERQVRRIRVADLIQVTYLIRLTESRGGPDASRWAGLIRVSDLWSPVPQRLASLWACVCVRAQAEAFNGSVSALEGNVTCRAVATADILEPLLLCVAHHKCR